MTRRIYISPRDAANELTRQIVAKHGDDPRVLEGLDLVVKRVPLGSTGRMVVVAAALPKGETLTRENICASASGVFDAP